MAVERRDALMATTSFYVPQFVRGLRDAGFFGEVVVVNPCKIGGRSGVESKLGEIGQRLNMVVTGGSLWDGQPHEGQGNASDGVSVANLAKQRGVPHVLIFTTYDIEDAVRRELEESGISFIKRDLVASRAREQIGEWCADCLAHEPDDEMDLDGIVNFYRGAPDIIGKRSFAAIRGDIRILVEAIQSEAKDLQERGGDISLIERHKEVCRRAKLEVLERAKSLIQIGGVDSHFRDAGYRFDECRFSPDGRKVGLKYYAPDSLVNPKERVAGVIRMKMRQDRGFTACEVSHSPKRGENYVWVVVALDEIERKLGTQSDS